MEAYYISNAQKVNLNDIPSYVVSAGREDQKFTFRTRKGQATKVEPLVFQEWTRRTVYRKGQKVSHCGTEFEALIDNSMPPSNERCWKEWESDFYGSEDYYKFSEKKIGREQRAEIAARKMEETIGTVYFDYWQNIFNENQNTTVHYNNERELETLRYETERENTQEDSWHSLTSDESYIRTHTWKE